MGIRVGTEGVYGTRPEGGSRNSERGAERPASSEATFEFIEARGEPETVSGELTVSAGEVIRFAPGGFESGRNDAERDLVVLAVGAPRGSADARLPVYCPDCGRDGMRMDADDGVGFVCPDCGAGRVPAPCPECVHDDLRVTPARKERREAGTVVICSDRGATVDDPPFRA